jgi:hypothetical protein
MFCPTGRALAQADHWAEFAGIRKWRTLEDTERGEVEALKVFVVHHSDIVRCPKVSMSARHYLPSGVCACQLDQQLKALEAREEEGADVAAELAVLRVSRREVVR